MEFEPEVSEIPQCNSSVGTSCGQDVLAVGIEREAVYLGIVGINGVTGFGAVIGPGIPSVRHVLAWSLYGQCVTVTREGDYV